MWHDIYSPTCQEDCSWSTRKLQELQSLVRPLAPPPSARPSNMSLSSSSPISPPLAHPRVVVIHGPSGCGKLAVLQALYGDCLSVCHATDPHAWEDMQHFISLTLQPPSSSDALTSSVDEEQVAATEASSVPGGMQEDRAQHQDQGNQATRKNRKLLVVKGLPSGTGTGETLTGVGPSAALHHLLAELAESLEQQQQQQQLEAHNAQQQHLRNNYHRQQMNHFRPPSYDSATSNTNPEQQQHIPPARQQQQQQVTLVFIHTVHDTHSDKADLHAHFPKRFLESSCVQMFHVPPTTELSIERRMCQVLYQECLLSTVVVPKARKTKKAQENRPLDETERRPRRVGEGCVLSGALQEALRATVKLIAGNAAGDVRHSLLQLQWFCLPIIIRQKEEEEAEEDRGRIGGKLNGFSKQPMLADDDTQPAVSEQKGADYIWESQNPRNGEWSVYSAEHTAHIESAYQNSQKSYGQNGHVAKLSMHGATFTVDTRGLVQRNMVTGGSRPVRRRADNVSVFSTSRNGVVATEDYLSLVEQSKQKQSSSRIKRPRSSWLEASASATDGGHHDKPEPRQGEDCVIDSCSSSDTDSDSAQAAGNGNDSGNVKRRNDRELCFDHDIIHMNASRLAEIVGRDDYVGVGHAAARFLTQKHSMRDVLAAVGPVASATKLTSYISQNLPSYFIPNGADIDALAASTAAIAQFDVDTSLVNGGGMMTHMGGNLNSRTHVRSQQQQQSSAGGGGMMNETRAAESHLNAMNPEYVAAIRLEMSYRSCHKFPHIPRAFTQMHPMPMITPWYTDCPATLGAAPGTGRLLIAGSDSGGGTGASTTAMLRHLMMSNTLLFNTLSTSYAINNDSSEQQTGVGAGIGGIVTGLDTSEAMLDRIPYAFSLGLPQANHSHRNVKKLLLTTSASSISPQQQQQPRSKQGDLVLAYQLAQQQTTAQNVLSSNSSNDQQPQYSQHNQQHALLPQQNNKPKKTPFRLPTGGNTSSTSASSTSQSSQSYCLQSNSSSAFVLPLTPPSSGVSVIAAASAGTPATVAGSIGSKSKKTPFFISSGQKSQPANKSLTTTATASANTGTNAQARDTRDTRTQHSGRSHPTSILITTQQKEILTCRRLSSNSAAAVVGGGSIHQRYAAARQKHVHPNTIPTPSNMNDQLFNTSGEVFEVNDDVRQNVATGADDDPIQDDSDDDY